MKDTFISRMLSHPRPDENHVNLMHWLYRMSCIFVVKLRWFLHRMTSKNDVSLCKLDVNVKDRTAVAGSVGCFKLELKLFKEKGKVYIMFFFKHQMW